MLEPRFAVSQLAAANHNSLQGDGDVVPRSGDAGNVGACMGWAGSPSIAVVLRKFQGLEIPYKLRGEVSRRAAPVMLLLYIMGFSVLVPQPNQKCTGLTPIVLPSIQAMTDTNEYQSELSVTAGPLNLTETNVVAVQL